MPTKLGHFEILSELAKSPTAIVYKANDPESGQTIVLKAIQLSAFGEHAPALVQALQKEAESTKALSSPNLTCVSGAGEIEGQFCAAMEYIQGNSIATMLSRKEGFSIWDLLDIGRQLTAGLDHASGHNIVHYSLEPAKIMCGWDGTVKILSFGVSSVGSFVQHVPGVSPVLHYMSPEQVRGDSTDGRSNLFSLGAMFYEMVTEQKAFDGADVDSLRQSILDSDPVAPIQLNAKVHPLLSDLIMKALSKDPASRHQTGRQLLDELENCKETRAARKAEPPKGTMAPDKARSAAQAKFINPGAASTKPAPAQSHTVAPQASKPSVPLARPAAPMAAKPVVAPAAPAKPSRLAMPKMAAAAAGVPGNSTFSTNFQSPDATESSAGPSLEASLSPEMSAALVEEPQAETFDSEAAGSAPGIAIDPLMAEGGPAAPSGTSFSEISELPPLKEVYVAPSPTPSAEPELIAPVSPAINIPRINRKAPEKPKVQPKEVAQKAIKEIKAVPPKLFFYSLAAAGVLILVIGIAVTIYIHSQNDDDTGSTRDVAPVVTQNVKPQPAQPAPDQQAAAPVETQPAATQPADNSARDTSESAAPSRSRNSRKKAAAAAPLLVPAQLTIDSTPQGAQIQFDGQTDPSWVTPLSLTQIQPGQHSVTISKAGYSTDTRTINVASGSHTTTNARLTQLTATLIVKSDPAGANIFVDGHDVGAKTPAQVSLGSGQHLVLVRMSGYLDETMSSQFVVGQTFNFSPTLRALGNADSIKTVGKMSKLFGGKADKSQGVISIHTSPKGAQVAINQHMLEKNSPVDVALDPGTYVLDITATGYAPIHRVVTVEKGSKDAIDEAMQPQ